MKTLKTIIVLLVLATMGLGIAGCGAPTNQASAADQVATVKRGNLTLDITAAGNLALSKTEDLPVDLFYPGGTKGTIASVLVEEGDTVKQGDVLVTLDQNEWDDELKLVKKALDTAQRDVVTKTDQVADDEIQVTTLTRQVTVKQNDVTKAERQVTAKEMAVTQAQLNIASANETLLQIDEVKQAQDAVDAAEQYLEVVNLIMQGVGVGEVVTANSLDYWGLQKANAKQELADAQENLQEILAGNNMSLTTDVKLQIAQKEFQVQQAQFALGDAQIALEDAKFAVDDAKLAVDNAQRDVIEAQQNLDNDKLDLADAQSTLADAQNNYDEALNMSPEITAPFDGFITKVNVAGGDEVLKGTIAVQIADPNMFEADILVNEMDISQVQIGGLATVTADANTAVAFPAAVTHIAPTATIQSGVVNYTVKVELSTLQAASQNQTTPSATGNATGTLPAMLQRAVDSGRLTQEQAEQMMQNGASAGGFAPSGNFTGPSGNFTLPGGGSFPGASGFSGSSQASTAASNFQLREGLTVTVNIIVASRTNVLLVPNAAVTTQGTQKYVQVVSASGATEKRSVQTGLSDWQYTEITDGLQEGEQVVVPETTTTTNTSSSARGGIGFFGPPGR
jgi:HlyD family secretion protein